MENRIRVVSMTTMSILRNSASATPGKYLCISLRRKGKPKILACDTTSGEARVRSTDSLSYAWEWLLNKEKRYRVDNKNDGTSDRLQRRARWTYMSEEQKRAERSKVMDDIETRDPSLGMTLRELLEDITGYAIQMGRGTPEPCQMVLDLMEYDGMPAMMAVVLVGHDLGYCQAVEPEEKAHREGVNDDET